MTEANKIVLVAFHMLGEDQMWYMKLEQEEPGLTWASLKIIATYILDLH